MWLGFLIEAAVVLGVPRHVAAFDVTHAVASPIEIGNFQSCVTESVDMSAHSKTRI